MLWRCWSPVNGKVPRHVVLYVRGKGWIDSTVREWRPKPEPHRKAWPVGAPVLAVIAALFWASPLRAQDAAFWDTTGCVLVPVAGEAWVAEVRCANFLTSMSPPDVAASLQIDGLTVHLEIAQTPGRIPDTFSVIVPDGFVADPPALVLDEETRGVVRVMPWVRF